MTREELEKRLESAKKQMIGLQDEIQNLKAKLAEAKDEPEIPDFPVFNVSGEDSWYINSILGITYRGHTYGQVDDYNYFHTEEYAQEFADKCKLIAMMLHCKWYLDRYYVPNWKNAEEMKYIVFYNDHEEKFGVSIRTTSYVVGVAFSTSEAARKCADWLDEHWRDGDDD